MAFKFEELKVWQKALDLCCEISEVATLYFPAFELYDLSNQIRKASDSVVLNIAEVVQASQTQNSKKFLNYSLRSAVEVVGCLFIAKEKKLYTAGSCP